MDIVLNWLTQGVMVAIVAAVVLRIIPTSRAQARHGVLWTAYLLVLALPAIPAVWEMTTNAPTVDLASDGASPMMTMPALWWTSPAMALALWMAWSCRESVRLVVSALEVGQARRRSRECPASVLARLPRWSRVSVSGRRTRVILSNEVRAAAVLGCGTPTIALTPTLITRLSVDDLDCVLIHEWVHVQRYDDLAQLAQRIVRIVVGWHPAAWWLEQQLELEREAACDEVAVAVTGSAKAYASCLTTLATLPPARPRAVAALAAAAPSRLSARIIRILAAPRETAARPWRAITVGAASGLLACTLAIANLQPVACVVTRPVALTAANPPRLEAVARDVSGASDSAELTTMVPRRVAAQLRASHETREPVTPEARPRVDHTTAVVETLRLAVEPAPLPSSALPLDSSGSLAATPIAAEPVLHAADDRSDLSPTPAAEPLFAEQPRRTWTRVADLGVDVGRASRTAGVATAGFFRRFGKKVAGAF